MSWWSYVTGNIIIDTYSNKETEESVREFLKKLPETSGSEGGCKYYVNILDGYNVSDYIAGKTIEYQTRYSVSIAGSLRDAKAKDVANDIENILERIYEEFDIRMCCIHISDTSNSTYFVKDVWENRLIRKEEINGKITEKEFELM